MTAQEIIKMCEVGSLIARFWQRGFNTASIARTLGKPESEIYNMLDHARLMFPRTAR